MLAGMLWGHVYIGKNPTFFGGLPKGFSRWKISWAFFGGLQ
jgi:hypothetical protein